MFNKDWQPINEKITRCRRLETTREIIGCLMALFRETDDGMVALALGEEYEKDGQLDAALEWFQRAELLFPMKAYENKARMAIDRVYRKKTAADTLKKETTPERETTDILEKRIIKLNSDDVLFFVSCSKKKIWDITPSAPEFVPARYAYVGDSFLRFIRWAEERKFDSRGVRWMILSGKYGFIEPWHPISYYDIAIDDELSFPVTEDFLRNQARQVRWLRNSDGRWVEYSLSQFSKIVCVNCGPSYVARIEASFPNKRIEQIEV